MGEQSVLPYICPEHPGAQIRHEWNRSQYVMNGYPAGRGIDTGHQFFCADCGRELSAEDPLPAPPEANHAE